MSIQPDRRRHKFFGFEVNLGSLIQIIMILVAGFWFFSQIRTDIALIVAQQRYDCEKVEVIGKEVSYIRQQFDKHMVDSQKAK